MQALTETTRPALSEADAAAASRRSLAAVPDRAQRDAAAALARAAFGRRLKEARERRAIGLETIAAMTKVNESLFVALERGDLSRWPTGIYRRAFFRAYAGAIGVSVDSSVNEFLKLFPDEHDTRQPVAATAASSPLRLSLAAAPRMRVSRAHLMAAFIDLAVLLLVSSAIAWWSGARPEVVLSATTLSYYVVATALFGSSAGAWWLRARAARRRFKGFRLARQTTP